MPPSEAAGTMQVRSACEADCCAGSCRHRHVMAWHAMQHPTLLHNPWHDCSMLWHLQVCRTPPLNSTLTRQRHDAECAAPCVWRVVIRNDGADAGDDQGQSKAVDCK